MKTLGLVVLLAIGAAGCGGSKQRKAGQATYPPARGSVHVNIYSHDGARDLSRIVRHDRALVYVPNTLTNDVTVIDQKTFKVLGTYPVGIEPQHVTPAWDLRTLYVDNDVGNSLTPIDPRTGRISGRTIPVLDPYNMYFTPNGHFAIVVAERERQLDFRTPHRFRLVHALSVPTCDGVDHGDFSAYGRYLYMSCEFNGEMIDVDLRSQKVIKTLLLHGGDAAPQDVKLSPDGQTLYVADQVNGGVWLINPEQFKVIRFLKTGAGAHGLYPSRDSRELYVTNREAGTISVIDFATRRIVATWTLPQPSSPDMGGVSADGRTLWLSGRYNNVVYAIDTRSGQLKAEIPVGGGPHGLCVWPQPGRYSLGHTGIMR